MSTTLIVLIRLRSRTERHVRNRLTAPPIVTACLVQY
jgi:hypothetical protein